MNTLLPPVCRPGFIDVALRQFKDYRNQFSYYEVHPNEGYENGWINEGIEFRHGNNINGAFIKVSNGRIGSWLDDYFRPTDYINPLSKTFHFKAWVEKDTNMICETLSVKGSSEVVKQCYEGSFEARLLLPICQDSYKLTLGQAIGCLAGTAAVIKVAQNLYAGNRMKAIVWSGIAMTSFMLPLHLKV